MLDALVAFAEKEGAPVVPVCAAMEAELQEVSRVFLQKEKSRRTEV